MNSSFDGNDPQVLEDFLFDLMCKAKRQEDIELLVDVIMTIQQPPGMPRSTHSPATLIDRPETRKQGRAG